MKKILVAVDETEASRRAAAFVDEFFSSEDYSVSAVNVARQPTDWMPATMPAVPFGAVSPWPYAPEMKEALARQEAAGEAIVNRQAPEGADTEVFFGDTVEAILAAADDVGADLIVVGSNDKGFLQRLFSGSVSEGLVRSSTRPVLVVR
jgi:nucleotide-binding universal stress UspA family protein